MGKSIEYLRSFDPFHPSDHQQISFSDPTIISGANRKLGLGLGLRGPEELYWDLRGGSAEKGGEITPGVSWSWRWNNVQ